MFIIDARGLLSSECNDFNIVMLILSCPVLFLVFRDSIILLISSDSVGIIYKLRLDFIYHL